MRRLGRPGQHAGMDDGRALELRLRLNGGDEPVAGVVSAPGGRELDFTGWSELFAALQVLLAEHR